MAWFVVAMVMMVTLHRLHRSRWLRSLVQAAALLALLGTAAGCRQERLDRDPVTEVNAPRPTNEVAEKIPGVTNPPPR